MTHATTANACGTLHSLLETLPLVTFPFDPKELPDNGIYFFYERGEQAQHTTESAPRIVRIGTHRDGNFRSRMADHFVLNGRKGVVRPGKSPPHDRSIFRKNIGRALLHKARDPYLDTWNIDFTPRANRELYENQRDLAREQQIEDQVTQILRDTFSFRYLVFEGQEARMGSSGIEAALIGTVARCKTCRPSPAWLGSFSPVEKIRTSGLWLSQHLDAEPLDAQGIDRLRAAHDDTFAFLKSSRGHLP